MEERMTDDEINAVLDRLCVKHFGKPYNGSEAVPQAEPKDLMERLRQKFPVLFDAPRSGNA
jgi:hypothetical protein